MRWLPFLLLLLEMLTAEQPRTTTVPAGNVDFQKHVRPILEKKCEPCHFAGGKMHAKLPFDQPATIVTLGEKLFTRIKDDDSRAVIRKFLAEHRTR